MEKSYLKGILGGFIGGMIASLPWILAYVYADMIFSLLAIIVSMGVLKGYQLLNGKIDKKLPIIVAVLSFLCITISTLIIIPGLLVVQNDASFTIENIKYLYSNNEFFSAIMHDYVISVLFTFLGISGIIMSINNQIKNSDNPNNLKFDFNNGNNKKDKEKVREYFISRNAINENNLIDVDNNEININTLNLLIQQGIVVKKDNKYYYLIEKEAKIKRNSKIVIIIVVAFVLIIFGLGLFFENKEEDSIINDEQEKIKVVEKNINVIINDSYREYVDDENEFSWFYVPKKDLSGESGFINVYYFESKTEYSKEWALQVKSNLEENGKVVKYEYFKNNYNLDVVSYDYEIDDYIDYIYYILGDNYIGVVEVIDYKGNKTLQTDGKNIAMNYKWLS